MKKFEYKIVYLSLDNDIEEYLNAHGNYGWELISVVYDGKVLYKYFLKRQTED